MSYTTVQSQQITSKDGELSIDVFNELDQHDNSKLILNCNSFLDDGIKINCPGGGISLDSQNINIKSVESKIQTKRFNLETVDRINISSLESVNLSALSSISISNQNDGFFYNVDNNSIDIINNEPNSIFNLLSSTINIGNSNSSINNNCIDFIINCQKNIIFKRYDRNIIQLYENDAIEITGNVYINGSLKFDKLESSKIKKIKLEDSQDRLEFGNDNTKILDWSIFGQHIDSSSEFKYNCHSNTFTFKKNNTFCNIKVGGLCVNNKGINILEIDGNNTNVLKINAATINSKELNVENTIKCDNIEVSGKKIVEHLGNIINNTDTNIENIIRNKDYVLINCDIDYNISIDKDHINLSGYHKNIIWTGKLNIKNVSKYSKIKNIIFRNAFISTINCEKLSFENCEFQNTKFFSEYSNISFNSSSFDVNSELSVNKVLFDKCNIDASIKANDICSIFLSKMNYNNNNKIILENNSVTYQIINNYITCKTDVNEVFSSQKDIIINDNWINIISSNKSEYQKNSVIKTKKTL